MQEQIHDILQSLPYKLILSKAKNCEYRKVQILKKEKNYQIEKYTQKQVFHENLDKEELEGLSAARTWYTFFPDECMECQSGISDDDLEKRQGAYHRKELYKDGTKGADRA